MNKDFSEFLKTIDIEQLNSEAIKESRNIASQHGGPYSFAEATDFAIKASTITSIRLLEMYNNWLHKNK